MTRIKCLLVASLALVMTVPVVAQPQERTHEGGPGRWGRMRERMSRDDGAPKVGDIAPTFTLKSLDGKSETDLADFKGDRPVVLFFGSYT